MHCNFTTSTHSDVLCTCFFSFHITDPMHNRPFDNLGDAAGFVGPTYGPSSSVRGSYSSNAWSTCSYPICQVLDGFWKLHLLIILWTCLTVGCGFWGKWSCSMFSLQRLHKSFHEVHWSGKEVYLQFMWSVSIIFVCPSHTFGSILWPLMYAYIHSIFCCICVSLLSKLHWLAVLTLWELNNGLVLIIIWELFSGSFFELPFRIEM